MKSKLEIAVAAPVTIHCQEFHELAMDYRAAAAFSAAPAAYERLAAFVDARLAAIQAQPDVAVGGEDARLEFLYQIACVKPFISPITTKAKWIASIDAAIQAQGSDAA